jgi:hypothetical protein
LSLSTFEADIQIIDIDTEQAINTRISVSRVNVTVNGFDVRVETWLIQKYLLLVLLGLLTLSRFADISRAAINN